MTTHQTERRWHLGDDVDAFLRITEPTTGDRVIWIQERRYGSMFPLTPDAARRLGQALLDYAEAVRLGIDRPSGGPGAPPTPPPYR